MLPEIIRIFYERSGMVLFDEIRSSRSAEELGWALSCVMMSKRITEYVKSLKEDECLKSYWKNVSFNVIIFILCRNYIQKRVYERVNNSEIDIDGRINNVIANYFSLKDSK